MDLVSTLEAEPTGLVEGLVTEELDRGWLLGLGAEKWTWSQKYIFSLKLHEDPPETRLTAGKPGWEEFVVHACS